MEDSSKQNEDRTAAESTTNPVIDAVPEKVARTRERLAPPTKCDCPPGCVGLPCCT